MALTTLTKALPQDRYIKIVSSIVGTPSFSDRDFGGLVFTEREYINLNGRVVEFAYDKMVEVYTADQAAAYFGLGEDETEIAIQYFSYMSPRGFAPRRLCFVRKNVDESPLEAIKRINGLTNNFGGFMYAQAETYTVAQMKEVVAYVHQLNVKYLFSLSFAVENEATEEPAAGSKKIGEINARDFALALANGESQTAYTGTTLWLGHNIEINEDEEDETDASDSDIPLNSAIAAIIPLAIFGAIRYDGTNTVTNFMFKRFPAQVYAVDDELEADAYDALCINYLGLVQANGSRRAFTQCGYNIDGTQTNVYCNEVWLKSEVATALLNLFMANETISVDDAGQALIFSTISSVASQAVNNGVIAIGKTLDEAQRTAVYQLTNDNEAWRTIENGGYYLAVEIRKSSKSGRVIYKAYYKLVYAKDDAIIGVEGEHDLV